MSTHLPIFNTNFFLKVFYLLLKLVTDGGMIGNAIITNSPCECLQLLNFGQSDLLNQIIPEDGVLPLLKPVSLQTLGANIIEVV